MVVAERERPVQELRFADDYQEADFQLREGLGYKARKEAELLYTFSRGVLLLTGEPGSGKDLTGTAIAAMNKYYFNRKCLLDFIPKRAFGEYIPFNARVMMQEINRMAKAAGMDDIKENAPVSKTQEREEEFEYLTNQWIDDKGETLLKNSILYLSELKRYCYNRNPHNPFNKFIGSICSVWRHLDILIIGTHVKKREIDQFSFLEYVTHWGRCSWSLSQQNTSIVKLTRGKFIGANCVYNVEGKPLVLKIDGGKPREWLEGKRFFDLYDTKSMVNLKPVIRKEM